MHKTRTIQLPAYWVDCDTLDGALGSDVDPHDPTVTNIQVIVPEGCKIIVDAGTRLLSLVNQLAIGGKTVSVAFPSADAPVLTYLNRLGFFDWLDPAINVLPTRPDTTATRKLRGKSGNVIEIIPISPSGRDRTIPKQLADRLEKVCSTRSDRTRLGLAAFTLFGELIDNIYEHSETKGDGFAALQVYEQASSVRVVVSDSGLGIIDTIRPFLTGTPVEHGTEPEVMMYLFNHGLSRFGKERGCGLRQCAVHALKFGAELYIRLPRSSVHLIPQKSKYKESGLAYLADGLPLIRGTHVSFSFSLDKVPDNLLN